ncbi:MAG: hypothetical protein JSR17_05610 [Proteobacteria bacterium]|nr:hypothetical protein [Pseudomonadota bacterium]
MAKKKSKEAAPSTADKLLYGLIDAAPTLTMTAAAVGGLWYFDAGSMLLNAVDGYIAPWVGSMAQNTAAQLASLAVETGLVLTAVKSTLWVGGRVQKANALEKENAALKQQLDEANKEEAPSDDEVALEQREAELNARETALNRKEGALKGQWTKFNKAKKEHEGEVAQFTATKQDAAKKAHDAAKKQTELAQKEEELNKTARDLEEHEAQLSEWQNELDEAQRQLDAERAEFESSKQGVQRPETPPQQQNPGEISAPRALLLDFQRQRGVRELARPLEGSFEQAPSADERAQHLNEESSSSSSSRSSRRSSSPSSVH